MATNIAPWVARTRTAAGLSQAQLAREISRHLGREFTRDQAWKLEHGMPENPSPQLVIAVTKALGRPIVEALEVLGYEVPPERAHNRIDPALADVVNALSIPAQRRLAAILPDFVALAAEVTRPTLRRVADASERYGPGKRKKKDRPV